MGKRDFHPVLFSCSSFFNLYLRTRLSRSLEQDNIDKSSESSEPDWNGTARLLVRLSYDFEQALRDALAAERENEGELATTSLEFQVPCGSARLCCQISANQREAETSANESKH